MKTQSVLFAQIAKVDETQRLVHGRAVQEVLDRSGEIFDYESSKPYFEDWSKTTKDATNGQSVGNVRAMHGKVAAGKLTDIVFNDAELAIDIVAKVVDDAEWKKVVEGVYTGFSIGGDYVKKWDTEEGKRYTADPSEISLVDRPCGPTSTFFKLAKADGTEEEVPFAAKSDEPADEDKPNTEEEAEEGDGPAEEEETEEAEKGDYVVEGTDQDVENLSKFLNDNHLTVGQVVKSLGFLTKALGTPEELGKALTDEATFEPLVKTVFADSINKRFPLDTQDQIKAAYKFLHKEGIEKNYDEEALKTMRSVVEKAWADKIGTELGKDVEKLSNDGKLAKGLYDVRELADILMNIRYVMSNVATQERIDNAPANLSTRLIASFNEISEIIMALIEEEVIETPEAVSHPHIMALSDSAKDLQKSLEKIGARNNKADAEKIQMMHDHAVALGANCGEAEKSEATDLEKIESPADEPLAKAMSLVDSLQKTVGQLTDRLTKLEQQPAPAKAILRVMSKGQDIENEPEAKTEIVTPDGQVNTVASLIKTVHADGGQPLLK